MATTLDSFLPLMSTQDTKKKLQIGSDLLSYLSIEDNTLACENIGAFIDSVIHWLNNSNFKVAQSGLEILAHLCVRMKDELKPYLPQIIGPTIDRLGDSKDCVREQAKVLLMKLMSFVSTPQSILEKLMPAFGHKNWKVREEICLFLQECLTRYGVYGYTKGQLLVSKFIAPLIQLISDPNSQVRDISMATLVQMYKHVGDKMRQEVLRKHSTTMPAQKLQSLLSKFDEVTGSIHHQDASGTNNINSVKLGGRARSTLTSPAVNNNGSGNHVDETDFKKPSAANKRATSAPPVKRAALLNKLPPSASKSSGAADEEMFMNLFEDVPRVQIYSVKDLEKELIHIRDTCSNISMDWEKRVECLKKFRSLLIAGAADYEEFYMFLKPLEVPFQTSVKDLRSQVVREACISIAYLSQRIGNKCDRFAEALLPSLIDSIQNSAKIMSSSAIVAIRFIIQSTHSSRLVPILTYNISSKSKEIRKACCEFLDQLLHTWPAVTLEKHVGALQEAIKKGISDADPEARALARKAFWGFADKFKPEADYLLSSLDPNKQRMLQGEQMSNWSSTNSLNRVPIISARPLAASRTGSAANTNGSVESINKHCNLIKRTGIPVPSPKTHTTPRVKATSAIDIDAQRRARAKASNYLNQPKVMLKSVSSLSAKKPETTPVTDRNARKNIIHNSGSNSNRVSKSQPGSRSASPSSRLNCYSNIPTPSPSNTTPAVKCRRMLGRDQSPGGVGSGNRFERKLSSSSSASRTKANHHHLTSSDLDIPNRILQPTDEQTIENRFLMSRKKSYDDQSDESETSSICSDTSFANYKMRKTEDIGKIIENLCSSHWSDRKDGLLGLYNFLRNSDERLFPYQLKCITDIFTRMLVDPHTKAFALFLNTLNELIHNYKNELNPWLHILMTKLFLKYGSDTLGSVQTRITKTFELIRESFPIEDQFNHIMRLLSDQTQTLNTKVKMAVLHYLSEIICRMDSSDFTMERSNRQNIQFALEKMISWTADFRSSDLRKHAQETFVQLYNLNSTEMIKYLNSIRKTYQDAALKIIDHKHKSRLNQSPATIVQTPMALKTYRSPHYDGNEMLNPADIYDSLKKTSDEIQKYSFNLDSETVSSVAAHPSNSNNDSNNILHLHHHVVDGRRIDDLSNNDICPNSGLIGDLSGKLNHTPPTSLSNTNGYSSNSVGGSDTPSSNGYVEENLLDSMLSALTLDSEDVFQQHLMKMSIYAKVYYDENAPPEEIEKWKCIYKSLLERLLIEKNNKIRVMILHVMSQMLCKAKKSTFEEFAEKTFKALMDIVSNDDDKELFKLAEETANYAVYNFDPQISFQLLKQYINPDESNLNIFSIKFLTKMVEVNPPESIGQLLPELMPLLLEAYDDKESAVRKTAVFCMVAIYGAVGEAMNPYLVSLSRSKIKLLKLYIDRSTSQQQQPGVNSTSSLSGAR